MTDNHKKPTLLSVGDLVVVKPGTHWDGSETTRTGIITGPGSHCGSFMILFPKNGQEHQFHKIFIEQISSIE